MKLIATWTLAQDEATENPIRVRWEDGTPATMEDFARIRPNSQSYPDMTALEVEFGYEVVAQ